MPPITNTARYLHITLLMGLCGLLLGACASPKPVMPPLGFRTTITIRDDTKQQLRTITDPTIIQRLHSLISTLTTQRGRAVITTPAASRQIIIIETPNNPSLRLDLWFNAISDGNTTWAIDEPSAIILFDLLGLEKPVRP